MTVSTTSTQVTYIGNGVTTVFPFSFIGVSADDLTVTVVNAAGTSSVLNPSLYSVTITPASPGSLWGIGGTVTYPLVGSPLAVDNTLTIERDVPFTQDVSIANQGAFYPQAVEQALDLLEMQIQQLRTSLSYTLRVPETDVTPPVTYPSASLRAGGYATFDDNGQPTVTFITPASTGPTEFGNPRKVVTSGTATINVTEDDSWRGVSIYQVGGSVTTVQLPATGGPYPIFDGGLNATTYPITVAPSGTTILGQASFTLRYNGSSATFYIDSDQVLVG